jgi:succinate dehydrogenase / fumarate reductase cytochrome b subunit
VAFLAGETSLVLHAPIRYIAISIGYGGGVTDKVDTSFFWLKRLHSLAGVILLIALVFFYLPFNSIAFMGPHAYDRAVVALNSFPLTVYAEIAFIAVPLAFYILMGLVIAYRSSANVIAYSYYQNWMYFLQRFAGMLALAYVLFYVWSTRLTTAFGDRATTFDYMQRYYLPTWVKVFSIVGVVAVIFYLCSGLTQALMTWGITATRRSRFVATIASWVLMIVLWFWGIRILFTFAK